MSSSEVSLFFRPRAGRIRSHACKCGWVPEGKAIEMVWADHLNALESIAGDRRADRRYRIEMEVGWRVRRRGRLWLAGNGTTIELSSGGILFDAGEVLPAGMRIELTIAWPVMLNGTTPMQMVVYGRTVRAIASQIAVRMDQHEFRTRAIRLHESAAARVNNPVRNIGRLH